MTASLIRIPNEISWLSIDRWQQYVESHPSSTIFHHRSWLELLHEQYGFEIQIPAVIADNKIRAAIPFLQTRSLKGKKKLISLPFTDYVPILADDQNAVQQLCRLVQSRFAMRLDTILIRTNEAVHGLPNSRNNVRHELATEQPFDQIESAFASSIQRNLRKASRQQLDFQVRADKTAIDQFFRLHVLTRRKLGIPVQSRTYFHRLFTKLIQPGLGWVGIVTKNEQPIAAVVLLGYNGRLVYKYAASDPGALDYRPNDLLVHNAIKTAAERGYQVFDFGITDRQQDGLRRFKQKWGAKETDVFYNYILGQPEKFGGPSRAVRYAGELIKRTPTPVCRFLGKAFYKYSQ